MQRYDLQNEFTSVELERQLLATMHKQPEAYYAVMDWVPPVVWAHYADEYKQLSTAITSEKDLPVLPFEIEASPEPLAIAQEIADLYQKREAAKLLQENLQKLYQTEVPTKELLIAIEQQLTQVQSNLKEIQLGQMTPMPSLFDGLLTQLQERHAAVKEKGVQAVGLETGFKTLDKHLGGLQEGIHLLAAEPGAGKSSLALQIARNVSSNGYPVLFVSFEESLERLTLKSLCALGGHDLKRFNEGWGDPSELLPTIKHHSATLANLHLVQGTRNFTVNELKVKARQLQQKSGKGMCLIVIDYLQKWANMVRDKHGDFRLSVDDLAADIRNLALLLKSPMLVISSQNRARQGEAQLTSFKESGGLEYDADSAMFLTKDEEASSAANRLVDLSLKKNRFGEPDQKIKLLFKANQGFLAEVDHREGY